MPGGKTGTSKTECEPGCSINNGINGNQKVDNAGQYRRGETHAVAHLYSVLEQTV